MTVATPIATSAAVKPARWQHLDQMRQAGFAGLPPQAPRHIGDTPAGSRIHVATRSSKVIYGPVGLGKTTALEVDIAGAALDPTARIVLLGACAGELAAWRPVAEYADAAQDAVDVLLGVSAEIEDGLRRLHAYARADAQLPQAGGMEGHLEPIASATWVFLDGATELEAQLGERSVAAVQLRIGLNDLARHGPKLGYRLVMTSLRPRRTPMTMVDQYQSFGPDLATRGLSTVHLPGLWGPHPLVGARLSPTERDEVVATARRLRAEQLGHLVVEAV